MNPTADHPFTGKEDTGSDGFCSSQGLQGHCESCVLSAMSCPWDSVGRFDPQILDLNSSGYRPLSGGGGPGKRFLRICNQKSSGDRLMYGRALLPCCPLRLRNWPKDDSQHLLHLQFPPHHNCLLTNTWQASVMNHYCPPLAVGVTPSACVQILCYGCASKINQKYDTQGFLFSGNCFLLFIIYWFWFIADVPEVGDFAKHGLKCSVVFISIAESGLPS